VDEVDVELLLEEVDVALADKEEMVVEDVLSLVDVDDVVGALVVVLEWVELAEVVELATFELPARLLYIWRRDEPPQYSYEFPIHVSEHVFPDVDSTLPAFGVLPQ